MSSFTRYKRYTEMAGGFGIGLDTVSHVADEFNIKIEVESKKGVGTTFILDFEDLV